MENIYCYLSDNIVSYLKKYRRSKDITEIRLRKNSCMQLTINGKTETAKGVYISEEMLDNIFYRICQQTIDAYEQEISNGYITLPCGHRVGIAGEYFYSSQLKKYIIKSVSSLNIRISRNVSFFYNQEDILKKKPVSSLVVGLPHSGKTSFLKLYANFLAENSYRVSVCDERKELSADNLKCDVLCGIPKADAVHMATRTLNPQFIICDEIGLKQEAKEILSAVNTGVKFICSAHGGSLEQIKKRPSIKMLMDSAVFERYILLSQENSKFYVRDVIDV